MLMVKIVNRCYKEMFLYKFGSCYKDGGGDGREDYFFKVFFLYCQKSNFCIISFIFIKIFYFVFISIFF